MDLERLKAGTANTRTVELHGASVVVRVLTEWEILEARAAALAFAEKIGLDHEGMTVDLCLRQLYAALTDAEGKKLAVTFERFRSLMTRREREYLIGHYLELEKECAPDLEAMTAEEFEAISEEVKKSPDMLLSVSSAGLLRRLAGYLESRQLS